MSSKFDAAKAIDLLGLIQPFTNLKKVSGHEWAGACPRCGGKDRFRADPNRGWFCRQCTGEPGGGGHWMDQVDFIMWVKNVSIHRALSILLGDVGFTKQELDQLHEQRRKLEAERAEQDRLLAEQAQTRLNEMQDWKRYNQHQRAVSEWGKRGINPEWVAYYGLGFAENKEFHAGDDKFYSDSLTIPVFRYDYESENYKVLTLKHRLLMDDAPGGKYRNHIRGCGAHIFKTDILQNKPFGKLLILEGEIKAMVTWQSFWLDDYCIDPDLTIWSIPTKSCPEDMIAEMQGELIDKAFICLDPDAKKDAEKLADRIGGKAIHLPGKIDDLINMGVIGAYDIKRMLEY